MTTETMPKAPRLKELGGKDSGRWVAFGDGFSVEAKSEKEAIAAYQEAMARLSAGDRLCCGRWFTSQKSYDGHRGAVHVERQCCGHLWPTTEAYEFHRARFHHGR